MADARGWELPAYEVGEFAPKRRDYAVVVPVINEGERIQRQLAKMRTLTGVVDLIIVDGGSTDGSLGDKILRDAEVRALAIKTGPGRLSAQLRIGLAWAMSKEVPMASSDRRQRQGQCSGHPGVRRRATPRRRPCAGFALRPRRYCRKHAAAASSGREVRPCPAGLARGAASLHRHHQRLSRVQPAVSLDERVRPFRDVFTGYELHYYLAIRAARLGFRVMELPVERRYPAGRVPTKIRGLAGYLSLFRTLLLACLGAFDPESKF